MNRQEKLQSNLKIKKNTNYNMNTREIRLKFVSRENVSNYLDFGIVCTITYNNQVPRNMLIRQFRSMFFE